MVPVANSLRSKLADLHVSQRGNDMSLNDRADVVEVLAAATLVMLDIILKRIGDGIGLRPLLLQP
jgi:hypothetical protein